MKRYRPQTIKALKSDRAKGLTIRELMLKYTMPKTSVWHHIKHEPVPDVVKKKILSARGGSAARAQQRWSNAEAKAKELTTDFTEEHSVLAILAMLYWAEGTKSSFVFTNTDPDMIRIFLKIAKKQLNVQDDQIDVLIRIYNDSSTAKCRTYWSKVTGLPRKTIRTNVHHLYNKTAAPYGMCRLTFRKGNENLKLILCLIRELTARMLPRATLP